MNNTVRKNVCSMYGGRILTITDLHESAAKKQNSVRSNGQTAPGKHGE